MGNTNGHQTYVSCKRLIVRVWSWVLNARTLTGIPCISLTK